MPSLTIVRFRRAGLALSLLLAGAPVAQAQWNITLVADETIPGIINLGGDPPSISGQEIAFFNSNNAALLKVGPTGVPLTVFQTAGTPIPGSCPPPSGPPCGNFFQVFAPYSFDGQTAVFAGSRSPGGAANVGVYALVSTGLTPLAGVGTDPLVSTNTAGNPAIDGDDLAFGGFTAIHVRRGGVEQLIDNATPLPGPPGTGNFHSFAELDFDGASVVFIGRRGSVGQNQGIYYDTGDGSGIHKLVDDADTAPGGSELFESFAQNRGIAIDGDDVVFRASMVGGRVGLFLSRGFGPPQLIADNNTILPGGTERYGVGFSGQLFSVSNGEVAFEARGQNPLSDAIFATHGGVIERVIGTGAVLGGRTVDSLYLGNEAREGDTIAFNVLFLGGSVGVYRADRGQLAVANSGMVANGAFANGLNNWTVSGTANVGPGPTLHMTADGATAGDSAINQTIATPNGSYMIYFDYRFTTTAGSLDVEINGMPVDHIPAPPTLSAVFGSRQVLISNPALMGLSGATLTIRLNHGSFSELFLRGIFSPLFAPPSANTNTYAEAAARVFCNGVFQGGWDAAGRNYVTPSVSRASSIVDIGQTNFGNALSEAISVHTPFFSGVQFSAAGSVGVTSCEEGRVAIRAETEIGFLVSGTSTTPVDIDYQLRLDGTIDLAGDFTQASAATVAVFLPAEIKTPRAKVRKNLFIVINPARREVSEIVPADIPSLNAANDLVAMLADGSAHITFTPTPPTGGADTSRRYFVSVRHDFNDVVYAESQAEVSVKIGEHGAEDSFLHMRVAPAFGGFVAADFGHTFDGTLSTDTPGIVLTAQDSGTPADDGDGVAAAQDVCPATPPGEAVNASGCGASQLDDDSDAWSNASDNCVLVANGNQRDTDADGYGNRCDADLNNNGIVNFADLALFRAAFGTANANADFNGDGGFVNFGDLAIFRGLFGKAPGPSGTVQ